MSVLTFYHYPNIRRYVTHSVGRNFHVYEERADTNKRIVAPWRCARVGDVKVNVHYFFALTLDGIEWLYSHYSYLKNRR